MVQNLLLAVAVGLVEGVWLYYSLTWEERPKFNLLPRRSRASATMPTSSYALADRQLA